MTRQPPRPQEFCLNDATLSELQASLSAKRFGTYLQAVNGNRAEAAKLYIWNKAVSGAFYALLQTLEVTLRNALDRQLTKVYGPDWYDNPELSLDSRCLGLIKRAKQSFHVDKTPDYAPNNVITLLSFGFWVSLLGSGGTIDKDTNRKANYEMTLWRPALRQAFGHVENISRKGAHALLHDLRMFRNRIAHHEPIFRRNLDKDYDNILQLMSWMAPRTRSWIEAHSRVPDLLATPPNAKHLKF